MKIHMRVPSLQANIHYLFTQNYLSMKKRIFLSTLLFTFICWISLPVNGIQSGLKVNISDTVKPIEKKISTIEPSKKEVKSEATKKDKQSQAGTSK